jgi:hypothetical protein
MKKATLTRTCLALLFLAFLCSTDCKSVLQGSVKNQIETLQKALASSDSELPRSITADISGDYSEHFSAKQVNIGISAVGSIKQGTAVFTIVAINEGPTQTTDFTPGFIVGFPGFAVGMRQDTVAAFVKHVQGNSTTNYYEGFYYPYYQTQANTDPVSHVTFSKADKLPSTSPLVVRYHLVGTFDFLAAYAPEPPSSACAQEAQAHSGRNPMYRADLCGAKKIVVKGNFDITQDFRSDFFE